MKFGVSEEVDDMGKEEKALCQEVMEARSQDKGNGKGKVLEKTVPILCFLLS